MITSLRKFCDLSLIVIGVSVFVFAVLAGLCADLLWFIGDWMFGGPSDPVLDWGDDLEYYE